MNVSLTPELEQYIRTKVDSGRYLSASEVVREALRLLERMQSQLQEAARLLKANPVNLLEKLQQLLVQVKDQDRQLATLQSKMTTSLSTDLLSQVREVAGIPVLTCQLEGSAKSLRELGDSLKSRLNNGIFLLAAVEGDKVSLLAGVTGNLTSRFRAGELMRIAAPLVGGKGGGRPDLAQGGGTDPSGIPEAFRAVEDQVGNQ